MTRSTLLAILFALGLTACGSPPDDGTVPKSTKEQGDARQAAPK